MKSDYADVLALQGTAKGEILSIGQNSSCETRDRGRSDGGERRILLHSGQGTMVHFATRPEGTAEDVVYEFDASGLIAAGLDPSRLQQLLNEAE